MPPWAWVFPVLASVLLAGSVFAAVHHAEVAAAKVGWTFGLLVLAVAVTVIEVAFMASLIPSGGPDSLALGSARRSPPSA